MERLTERKLNDLGGVAFKNCHQEDCDGDCWSCAVQVEAEHKLKEYEDLEEQGLLLKLPSEMHDVDKKILWNSFARAISLIKYGVDVSDKQFETATETQYALNQAYIRGRQDEIDRILSKL